MCGTRVSFVLFVTRLNLDKELVKPGEAVK